MSKPPKVVIPGLNRGSGIRGDYIVGRHRGGKGPAQLFNLHDVVRLGIQTVAGSSQGDIGTASTAHSETVSVSTSNSTSLSQISSSLSGAISVNTGQSTSLSQISSSLSGAISVNTGQSTSLSQISSSLSGAISSTSSLSSAVSTVISGSVSTLNSRIDSVVAGGGGGDDDTALSTSLSNQSTSLSQISSSLSSEISSRSSGDTSLSTVISGSISTVNSSITSLSSAVSTVDSNQSTSISINLSKINSLSTALGSGTGAAWTHTSVSVTSGVSDIAITGLSGANEILAIGAKLTTVSVTFRSIQVSVDNGVSWFTTSGDYVEQDTNGAETNKASIATTGNASTALTVQAMIHNASNGRMARSSNAGLIRHFVASTSPINAVRIVTGTGNFNAAGTFDVWYR